MSFILMHPEFICNSFSRFHLKLSLTLLSIHTPYPHQNTGGGNTAHLSLFLGTLQKGLSVSVLRPFLCSVFRHSSLVLKNHYHGAHLDARKKGRQARSATRGSLYTCVHVCMHMLVCVCPINCTVFYQCWYV